MPNTTIVSSSKPVMSTKTPPPLITSMPGKSTFSGDSMSTERISSVDPMPTEPKMKPQQQKSFRINGKTIATFCGVALIGFGLIGTVYSKTMSTEPKTELQQMGGLDDLVVVATISGVVLLSINSLHGQFTNLNDKFDNKIDTLGAELKQDIREIRNSIDNLKNIVIAQANQKEKS